MVFNCNMNEFSRLTSIINLYNENMNLEMTIKKLGSVYKIIKDGSLSFKVTSMGHFPS